MLNTPQEPGVTGGPGRGPLSAPVVHVGARRPGPEGVPGRRKGQHWQHGRQSTTLTKTPPEALGWSVYLFCLSECLVIVCEGWAVMDEKTSSGTVITEGCVLFYLFLTGY